MFHVVYTVQRPWISSRQQPTDKTTYGNKVLYLSPKVVKSHDHRPPTPASEIYYHESVH